MIPVASGKYVISDALKNLTYNRRKYVVSKNPFI